MLGDISFATNSINVIGYIDIRTSINEFCFIVYD